MKSEELVFDAADGVAIFNSFTFRCSCHGTITPRRYYIVIYLTAIT